MQKQILKKIVKKMNCKIENHQNQNCQNRIVLPYLNTEFTCDLN